MARAAQLTFEQRISRIENKYAESHGRFEKGQNRFAKGKLMRPTKKARRVHWNMLLLGILTGGVAGTFFAMNVGLLYLSSLDVATLQQLMMTDYETAGWTAAAAIAPIGFVVTQIFARSTSRLWQFWVGYFAAVLGSNTTDIQILYELFVSSAG